MQSVVRVAAASAAFVLTFPAWAAEPAPAGAPDLAKAQQIVNQVCVACHGADGNSAAPAYPNIAGQPARYVTTQLDHFKAGIRENPIMAPMAANLSEDDMKSLGAYFAKQQPKMGAAKDKDLATAGQKIYRGGDLAAGIPACAACHSPDGVGVPAQYPRLSGQHTDYTYTQLKAFQSGARGHHDKDVNGRIMASVAAKLSDADMHALAEYVAGLR